MKELSRAGLIGRELGKLTALQLRSTTKETEPTARQQEADMLLRDVVTGTEG